MTEAGADVADKGRVELTLRGVILGVVITFFFTAANVPGTTVDIIGGSAGQVAEKATLYTTN